MQDVIDYNRRLALRINQEIWNEQKLELIPECFTEDFVADYSPRVIREGRDEIEKMVCASHTTFQDFKETVHQVVADEQSVALRFTITGIQVADWGSIPATNLPVKYDEFLFLTIRDGKVCRQVGLTDALLALQQLKRIPDPAGYVAKSFAESRDESGRIL